MEKILIKIFFLFPNCINITNNIINGSVIKRKYQKILNIIPENTEIDIEKNYRVVNYSTNDSNITLIISEERVIGVKIESEREIDDPDIIHLDFDSENFNPNFKNRYGIKNYN